MRNLIYVLLIAAAFTSCTSTPRPLFKYELDVLRFVPDSLESEYRSYIKELTQAAHYNLSAGEYEEADHIVYSARNIADELYEAKELGLRKIYRFSSQNYESLYIPCHKMTEEEKIIFKELQNK